ncbi:MAG: M81 family metallopeptidase [Rhodospirillales bacterium]|jgi:microcystin degradation protein MlrC|nr:M81 family metallopeptidase [Rhodospirillales bacterium]MDP6883163.1 M81 family metallopeptidase [Rhodospirillales bacterium]
MTVIAVGGWHHETNTFAPTLATYEAFTRDGGRPALCRGEDMLAALEGFNLPAAGFIDTALAQGHEVRPLLWCEATPSAAVTRDAYERISAMLIEDLENLMASDRPPQALYLDLHGAMVAEHLDDGEGEFLSRVRGVVGDAMPLVASLDLHANVTAAMVDRADVLVAYRTYPHVDRRETGERAAGVMDALLAGGRKPDKAFRQVPFLIPLTWQCTMVEPMASVYDALAEGEVGPGVLSASVLAGFPLTDIPDCGPSVVAYGRDAEAAEELADRLSMAILEREEAFDGKFYSPDEAVEYAISRGGEGSGPIILADTQDNPGAGGNADTVGILDALVRHGAKGAVLGVMCDAEVAAAAHAAGEGAEITASLGAKSGQPGHTPLTGNYRVERLGDGRFTARGPMYDGFRMRLGPMALLNLDDVRIAVASAKQQAADKEMFRHLGVEPAEVRILALKSSVHFRNDFTDVAQEILVVEAPGPSIADPAKLPFKRLRPGLRIKPKGKPLGE